MAGGGGGPLPGDGDGVGGGDSGAAHSRNVPRLTPNMHSPTLLPGDHEEERRMLINYRNNKTGFEYPTEGCGGV